MSQHRKPSSRSSHKVKKTAWDTKYTSWLMAPELQHDEKLHLAGTGASIVLYCINCYLFASLAIGIHSQGRDRPAVKSKLWRNSATILSFILVSIYLGLRIYVTFLGLTEHRDPEGSFVSWLDNSKRSKGIWLAIWLAGLGSTWAIDASVLYQCFILYSDRGKFSRILVLPVVFLLSSLGSGAYLLFFPSSLRVLPHFPICIATKLLMSSFIVLKLVQQRKKLALEFKDANLTELARPYTFLISVLVQSFALYSMFSITFLMLYVSNISAWRVFPPCLSQTGLMSQLLIQIRVLRNRTQDVQPTREIKPLSPIVFTRPLSTA